MKGKGRSCQDGLTQQPRVLRTPLPAGARPCRPGTGPFFLPSPVEEPAGLAVPRCQRIILQRVLEPLRPAKDDERVLEGAQVQLTRRRAIAALCSAKGRQQEWVHGWRGQQGWPAGRWGWTGQRKSTATPRASCRALSAHAPRWAGGPLPDAGNKAAWCSVWPACRPCLLPPAPQRRVAGGVPEAAGVALA